MSDVISDIGAEAPARPDQVAQLYVRLLLDLGEGTAATNNGSDEGAVDNRSSGFIEFRVKIAGEEPLDIQRLLQAVRGAVVQFKQGSDQAERQLVVAPEEVS